MKEAAKADRVLKTPTLSFMTNPAGAAIVDSVGPIRQIVEDSDTAARKYLVVADGNASQTRVVVQVQRAN
ncbi:MAG: hypothetical protein JWP16_1537 [Alphaproteobacteria bacterium]|nr:hypothetical protein [Alphaproteobacteria bacterium]